MKHRSLNLTYVTKLLDIVLSSIYHYSREKKISQNYITILRGYSRRLENFIRHHEMLIARRKEKKWNADQREYKRNKKSGKK